MINYWHDMIYGQLCQNATVTWRKLMTVWAWCNRPWLVLHWMSRQWSWSCQHHQETTVVAASWTGSHSSTDSLPPPGRTVHAAPRSYDLYLHTHTHIRPTVTVTASWTWLTHSLRQVELFTQLHVRTTFTCIHTHISDLQSWWQHHGPDWLTPSLRQVELFTQLLVPTTFTYTHILDPQT